MVVAAALVAGDFAARAGTQDLIASDVQKSTHSQSARVSISSFPFLYDVAAVGRVDHITIADHGVPAGPVRLDQVTLDATRVYFARRQLLEQHFVHITEVGRATVTIVAHLSALEGSLAHRLGVQVTARGSDRVAITAGGLTLLSLDLTRAPIIPACPLSVAHDGDTYTFSCTVAPVPGPVLAALSRAVQARS